MTKPVAWYYKDNQTGKTMAELSQSPGRNRGRIRSKKLSTRIDMTPMVDLAFLLLTFFILTTSLQKPFALQIEKPREPNEKVKPPEVPERDVITFLLDKTDQLFWYKGITYPKLEKINHDELHAFLIEKQKENPSLVILVKATNTARYENFVNIMDEIIYTEMKRYFIVDITPSDEKLLKDGLTTATRKSKLGKP